MDQYGSGIRPSLTNWGTQPCTQNPSLDIVLVLVLGIKPRAFCMPGKYSTTELYSSLSHKFKLHLCSSVRSCIVKVSKRRTVNVAGTHCESAYVRFVYVAKRTSAYSRALQSCQAWRHMPVILGPGRQRRGSARVQRLAWAT